VKLLKIRLEELKANAWVQEFLFFGILGVGQFTIPWIHHYESLPFVPHVSESDGALREVTPHLEQISLDSSGSLKSINQGKEP
jgi:hypothetical protein